MIAFNTYFVNIGKNLAKSIPSMPGEFQGYLPKSKQNQNSLFLKPVTVTEIIKVGSSLKSGKACGSDGIAPKVVKNVCIPLLTHWLTFLTNHF